MTPLSYDRVRNGVFREGMIILTEETGKFGTDPLNGEEKNYSRTERIHLGRSGCALLALCFAAALTYSFGRDWFDPSGFGPGIGRAVSHLVLTAAALLAAKRQKRLRPGRMGIFLLVLSVLLGASYAVFANAVRGFGKSLVVSVLCYVAELQHFGKYNLLLVFVVFWI